MSEIQYFTHIQAFFSLPYESMPAEKKSPTAHKLLHFRCGAVLKEKIFVTARRKSEGICDMPKIFNEDVAKVFLLKPYLLMFTKVSNVTKRRSTQVGDEAPLLRA